MKRLLTMLFLIPTVSAQAVDFDADEMLAAHNHWRETMGVPPLTYSPELAVSAQEWADNLKQNNQCRMQHSKPDGQYGENLFWASAMQWSNGELELQKVSPEKVVDSWGNENVDYNYASNSCTSGKMCGHYTQLVWKNTTSVGCAISICDDSKEQIWVCQYHPAGNWIGEKPY